MADRPSWYFLWLQCTAGHPDPEDSTDMTPTPPSPDPVLPIFIEALRSRRAITFALADLGNRAGLVDLQTGTVFLSADCSLGEFRATIAHELHHLNCPECPEDEVEQMTAELLVPLHDALIAQARGDLAEVAERLGVDVKLVRARMRGIAQSAEDAG